MLCEVTMVDKGQNQTFVRDNNMKLILFSLLEGEMSCSDLAEKLKLSKPALTKITLEMLDLDLIVAVNGKDKTEGSLGRKKSYFTINEFAGIVAAIDFSTVNIRIGVYNLLGKELAVREIVDSEFVTEEILQRVSDELAGMLKEDCLREQKLLCLCIGASGKVDKKTGEIVASPKFRQCSNINLKRFFETRFSASVLVKNDMDLSLLAEIKYGSLRREKENNAVLVYIDSGIGGAILSDGNILSGRHGFAGEFGLFVSVDDDGVEKPLDCIVSINAIKEKIKLYQEETGEVIFEGKFRFKDVKEKFFEGNATVRRIVFRSADYVARLSSGLIDMLDIERILISGRIRAFGEEYLEHIRNNKLLCLRPVKIEYSGVGNAVLAGAAYLAIETAFDLLIMRRKSKILLSRND